MFKSLNICLTYIKSRIHPPHIFGMVERFGGAGQCEVASLSGVLVRENGRLVVDSGTDPFSLCLGVTPIADVIIRVNDFSLLPISPAHARPSYHHKIHSFLGKRSWAFLLLKFSPVLYGGISLALLLTRSY